MRGQRILDRYGNAYDDLAPLIQRRRGHRTLNMDARSSMLLNPDYATQGDRIGMVQPFPSTALALLAALGNPVGWTAPDCYGAYLADSASPLVDSLGFGPALPSNGASAITGREGVGLPTTTSFNAKVVAEITSVNGIFAEAAASGYFGCPAGEQRSLLALVKINPGATLPGRLFAMIGATNSWYLQCYGSYWVVRTFTPGAVVIGTAGAVDLTGAWTWAAVTFDGPLKHFGVLSELGGADNLAGVYGPNDLVDATGETRFGSAAVSAMSQIGGFWWFKKILTHAMCDTFFRAFKAAALGTPCVYTRTTAMRSAITASRVAAYGAGQVGVAYDAGAVDAAGGNALGLGVLFEEGATFLGLGTNNQTAYVGTNATVAAADGPDGMRSAARVTDADGANAGYASSLTAPLAGATAVPFAFAFRCQAVAAGGLNAIVQAYFTGDAGGPETFTISTLAGTVPAAWGRFDGTCTPTGNAHTGVALRLLPTDGVAASTGVVDFSVAGGIQNSARFPAGWMAAGAVSVPSAATTLAYSNAGNRRYNPSRGSVRVKLSGFPGVTASTFLGYGAAAAAGSLVLDYTTYLRLRLWDAAGALVDTINAGAIGTGLLDFLVEWDARAPLALVTGVAGKFLAVTQVASTGVKTLLGSGGAAHTPAVAGPANINVGTDAAGANPARCTIISVVNESM